MNRRNTLTIYDNGSCWKTVLIDDCNEKTELVSSKETREYDNVSNRIASKILVDFFNPYRKCNCCDEEEYRKNRNYCRRIYS